MKAPLVAMFATLMFAAPPLAAAQVRSVEVHAGWVDIDSIVSGEKTLPLSEPTVELQPAFDNDIESYTVRMPYGAEAVTLVVERSAFFGNDQFGVVDFNGVSGQYRGATYKQQQTVGGVQLPSDSIGTVLSFRLQPGDNELRLGYRSTFGDATVYVLTITRPDTASGDTTLAALAVGGGELSPSFDPDTRMYRTRIVGNALTVTPTASSGSAGVTGTAADGSALQVDGYSVSGLTAGENSAAIAVRAEDGSSATYTLTVEVSDDIREVAEGDTISRQSGCDSDVGCDGTLNGVQGRFACDGVDWRSESSNVRISVSGLCLLSTSGGVVTSAAGWYFAAFPPQGR